MSPRRKLRTNNERKQMGNWTFWKFITRVRTEVTMFPRSVKRNLGIVLKLVGVQFATKAKHQGRTVCFLPVSVSRTTFFRVLAARRFSYSTTPKRTAAAFL